MNLIRALLPALVLAAALPARAAAQAYPTDRGSFIVGGVAGLVHSRVSQELVGGEQEYSSTQLSVAPEVEYFVAPGLAVGGRFQVLGVWSEDTSQGLFGIGPQLSYYFGRDARSIYPYVSGGVSYFNDIDFDARATGADAAAGLVFMLSRGVGLNTALFYDVRVAEQTRVANMGVSVGVSAFVF